MEILSPLAKVCEGSIDGENVADESNNLVGVLEFLTNPIFLDEVLGLDGDDSRAGAIGGSKQHHEASTGVEGLQSVLIDPTKGTLADEHFLTGRDGRGHEHRGVGCIHVFYSINLFGLSSVSVENPKD